MAIKMLTPRQKIFADAYLRLGNATAAAREAGYKATYGSLRTIASQNLKKPHIRLYIDKAMLGVYHEGYRIMAEEFRMKIAKK